MSIMRLPKENIDTLVEGMLEFDVVREKTPDEVGQMLWEENYNAVNEHYNENDRPEYHYTPTAPTNREIYDAVGEYSINTYTSSTFEASDVDYYLDTLKDNMLRHYIEDEEKGEE